MHVSFAFQYKISSVFSTVFQKVDSPRPKYINFNSNSSCTLNHHWFIICQNTKLFDILRERIDNFKLFAIWGENVNLIIFRFLRRKCHMKNHIFFEIGAIWIIDYLDFIKNSWVFLLELDIVWTNDIDRPIRLDRHGHITLLKLDNNLMGIANRWPLLVLPD